MTASENMTLHYVTGSAKIYNGGKTNGNVLSTNLFSEQGTYLGYDDLDGIVPGCDEYSGHVNYTIQTERMNKSITKPSLMMVIAAIVVSLLIVAAVIIFRRKRKGL